MFLARLERARDQRETVLVFGDFDADGITGLAVLTLALRTYGITVVPYVPSRLDEGHGLSLAAVDAASAAGASVLITVDTGTTSIVEIAAAQERGIDVLVTDHHRVPDRLPMPRCDRQCPSAGQPLPGRRPSGAGIAFALARLLLGAGDGRVGARRTRRHRDDRRRRADPRREPLDRPSRARADADVAPARHRGAPGAGEHRPPSSRRRGAVVRALRRASTRPGGWGRRWTRPGCC